MNPFEFVKNINTKSGLEEELSGFDSFIVTRVFSNTMDTIFVANEANKFRDMPKDMVYRFFYHAVNKNPRRFGAWNKSKPPEEDVKLIMELYNYSRAKAEEVYPLFNDLKQLRHLGYKGGTK